MKERGKSCIKENVSVYLCAGGCVHTHVCWNSLGHEMTRRDRDKNRSLESFITTYIPRTSISTLFMTILYTTSFDSPIFLRPGFFLLISISVLLDHEKWFISFVLFLYHINIYLPQRFNELWRTKFFSMDFSSVLDQLDFLFILHHLPHCRIPKIPSSLKFLLANRCRIKFHQILSPENKK